MWRTWVGHAVGVPTPATPLLRLKEVLEPPLEHEVRHQPDDSYTTARKTDRTKRAVVTVIISVVSQREPEIAIRDGDPHRVSHDGKALRWVGKQPLVQCPER